MIAMKRRIERMKLIANVLANSSPVWGPFVVAPGAAGRAANSGGGERGGWGRGGGARRIGGGPAAGRDVNRRVRVADDDLDAVACGTAVDEPDDHRGEGEPDP